MTGLTWPEIAGRFATAQNWWAATTGPAGPHAVPVWGVVIDDALHFYGAATLVRSRNLAADPRIVLHLESGSSVLILHGVVRDLGPIGDSVTAVAAYRAKYVDPSDEQYLPDAPGVVDNGLYVVDARKAIAWELYSAEWVERRWSSATSGLTT